MLSISYKLKVIITGASFMLVIATLNQIHPDQKLVLNNILETNITGQKIFFVETSGIIRKNFGTLNNRQACSIESAALMNPGAQIYVVLLNVRLLKLSKEVQLLRKFKNVSFLRANYVKFSKNTPLKDFAASRKLEKSKYPLEHSSDFLRILLLWRYGGTYFDLDVISLVPLNSIEASNFLCSDHNTTLPLASCILRYEDKVGKEYFDRIVTRFAVKFDGNNYVINGPWLFTETFKHFYGEPKDRNDFRNSTGFMPFDSNFCFPFEYQERKSFYKPYPMLLEKTKNSYFAHIWGNGKEPEMMTNSKTAYVELAEKYCPSVFEASSEWF